MCYGNFYTCLLIEKGICILSKLVIILSHYILLYFFYLYFDSDKYSFYFILGCKPIPVTCT